MIDHEIYCAFAMSPRYGFLLVISIEAPAQDSLSCPIMLLGITCYSEVLKQRQRSHRKEQLNVV